jgi:hypothetical protein
MNAFPKTIKPGDVIDLHGDIALLKSVKIPAGKPVTIQGNAHIHFAGKGAKVGMDSLFVFNVGVGATLIVQPGLFFDLTPRQGVAKLSYDPKRGGSIKNGPSAYLNGVWQNNGNLVWCQGMKEVIAKGCFNDGVPDKYYAITSTNPNGRFILDFRGLTKKVIKGGKNEAPIRSMQTDRFELYGATVREQTKQGVQIRSGNTALVQECDLLMLAEGWIEDADIEDVDPLNHVDIVRTKLKGIDWGAGQNGQVFRDGKRIK